ncbi:MAG: hypothetical protein AAGF71_11385 [Pseudomonadota bacterium]
MIRAAAAVSLAIALAGCGTPWSGGDTTEVAPIAVATVQLTEPVVAGSTDVAQVPAVGSAGEVVSGVEPTGAVVSEGKAVVEPIAVASAPLVLVDGEGQSVVAPVAGVGTPGSLVPIAGAGSATGEQVSAPSTTASALPPRTATDDANPVAFALATSNVVGVAVYSRPSPQASSASACAAQGSEMAAQRAFLQAGGPQEDPLGLDPDGDGFACDFDPEVFRRAAG